MQLSSLAPTVATRPTPPPPTAPPAPLVTPARDRVRPLLGELGTRLPDVVLDTRIGKGTVASEFDRNVRVRFEGKGPAGERPIVAETTTAQRLLASPAGPALERMLRTTAGIAQAVEGADSLRTITLTPDEHATKAAKLISDVDRAVPGTGPIRLTTGHWSKLQLPAAEQRAAKRLAQDIAGMVPSYVKFAAGWNGGGHIVIAPDVSRNLLASIGAYTPTDGDSLLARPDFIPPAKDLPPEVEETVQGLLADGREAQLRDDYDTLVHERHHSFSEMRNRGSEQTSIFEEAVATIFGNRDRARPSLSAGADIPGLAANPTEVVDRGGLGWGPWNRDHLPAPPAQEVEHAEGRYVDGPRVVRDLLRDVVGVDIRTKAGHADAFQLLQARPAREVPRVLAAAIIERRGIDPSHLEGLVDRVRRSVTSPSGAQLVADFLETVER